MTATINLSGTGPQLEFWSDTTSAELAFIGPLGCGKTYALAVKEAILRFENPRCDGLLVVPTYPMATAIHKLEWPAIWSNAFGVQVRLIEGEKDCFVWPWGARTWIRSAEKPDRYKGINASNVTFDEPGQISRTAYDVGVARARHPAATIRQTVLGGTPEGMNWLADLFDRPKPPRRTIFANVWHRDMAHYRDQLVSIYGYDKNLLDSYVRGRFVPLRVGRAFGQFSRHVHVRPVEHNPKLPVVLACDFNVDAMRWEVLQFHPREIRVVDEIALGGGGTTAEAAREFVRRYKGRCLDLTVTGDAAGSARSTSGSTDYAVLAEELRPHFDNVRFVVPPSNPPVRDRVRLCNYHMTRLERPVLISDKCGELVTDLERVTWRPGTTDLDKSDPLRTHASDAFGYALWMLAPAVVAATRPVINPSTFHDPVAQAEF